ncbi:MAG: helicase RepA family protein [Gammaproteobacteria bacterium]|nr:helicase RepA family protein [Gammaproteobacteria bacterium]
MPDLPPNVKRIEQPATAAGNDAADWQDNPEAVAAFRELVSAAIAPAPHPLKSKTVTLSLDNIQRRPIPRELLCGYWPAGATSAVVAMGGVGKTTFLMQTAANYVSDSLHCMFVTAEDSPEDYHAKLHNLLFTDKASTLNPAAVADKIHVLNLRGDGVKLIAEAGGSFMPSTAADDLAVFITENYPKVRVVFFETVSRFAGGEDNDRMEAVVSACDRIGVAINGACVLVHHTGKGQARDKVIDLYAGRGGSALGDNTRSMIVLTRLDNEYRGAQPIVVDREDIDSGRVFEVTHVRNSYGPTREPQYFITRQGYCHGPILESVPIANAADVMQARLAAMDAKANAAASKIRDIIESKHSVPRKFFDAGTKSLIGITQAESRALIEEMLETGALEVVEEPAGKATRKMLRLAK